VGFLHEWLRTYADMLIDVRPSIGSSLREISWSLTGSQIFSLDHEKRVFLYFPRIFRTISQSTIIRATPSNICCTKQRQRKRKEISKDKSFMEEFRHKYLSRCKELNLEPSSIVLEQTSLHRSDPSYIQNIESQIKYEHRVSDTKSKETTEWNTQKYPDTLDLSRQNLSLKGVTALTAALASDCVFARFLLGDAFIGDDGVAVLCNALKTNSTIQELDLRGNSIRSDGAVALAQLLKVNTTLSKLLLEWNCIGIWDTGVEAIADALSTNTNLSVLDLRNNKISPSGTEILAQALKRNTRLRTLDIRWNNAGLLGGKALADMLKWNTTLCEIHLAGNQIPEEHGRSIALALDRNQSRWASLVNSKRQADHLSSTLQAITTSHKSQINQLQIKLSETDSQALSLSKKLSMASNELDKERVELKIMSREINELRSSKEKLEETLTRERGEFHAYRDSMGKEIESCRLAKDSLEESYRKQLSTSKDQLLKTESKLRACEAELAEVHQQKLTLEKENNRLREKDMSLANSYEDKISDLERLWRIKSREGLENAEIDWKTNLIKVEERVKFAEAARSKAEEALEHYRSKTLQQKKQRDEEALEQEKRLRNEFDSQRKGLEKQIQILQSQISLLQANIDQKADDCSQLTLKNSRMQSKLEEMTSTSCDTISHLKTRISSLESEINLARENEKGYQGKINLVLNDLQETKDKLMKEQKERQIVERDLEEKLTRIRSMNQEYDEKENRRRLDEMNRLRELETAFSRYIGNAINAQTVSPMKKSGLGI